MVAQPLILRPVEAEAFWLFASRCALRLTGRETGGAFMLMECEIHPGDGPPPHTHHREDETFHVLEGELQVMTEGKTHTLTAGMTGFLPRDIQHTFLNATDKITRVLILANPAGIEEFFLEIGKPAGAPGEPPPPVTQDYVAHVVNTAREYGIDIPPPPAAAGGPR